VATTVTRSTKNETLFDSETPGETPGVPWIHKLLLFVKSFAAKRVADAVILDTGVRCQVNERGGYL
jgi:hypothetical protein